MISRIQLSAMPQITMGPAVVVKDPLPVERKGDAHGRRPDGQWIQFNDEQGHRLAEGELYYGIRFTGSKFVMTRAGDAAAVVASPAGGRMNRAKIARLHDHGFLLSSVHPKSRMRH